jgi:hypothetical protein
VSTLRVILGMTPCLGFLNGSLLLIKLDLPVITKDRTLIKLSPVNTIW